MLRTFIKRTLKAHLGPDKWITPILECVPTEDRKKLEGVDRDLILRERLFLINLLTVVDVNWDKYFKPLESCPPDRKVTKDQFRILGAYINAHREDAHAKPVSEVELVTLKIAAAAIENSISYLVAD
jgi:hypothetical protein